MSRSSISITWVDDRPVLGVYQTATRAEIRSMLDMLVETRRLHYPVSVVTLARLVTVLLECEYNLLASVDQVTRVILTHPDLVKTVTLSGQLD